MLRQAHQPVSKSHNQSKSATGQYPRRAFIRLGLAQLRAEPSAERYLIFPCVRFFRATRGKSAHKHDRFELAATGETHSVGMRNNATA